MQLTLQFCCNKIHSLLIKFSKVSERRFAKEMSSGESKAGGRLVLHGWETFC
jgi:hypothetical protein